MLRQVAKAKIFLNTNKDQNSNKNKLMLRTKVDNLKKAESSRVNPELLVLGRYKRSIELFFFCFVYLNSMLKLFLLQLVVISFVVSQLERKVLH